MMNSETKYTLEEANEVFAKRINGRTWELMEKPGRTQLEDEEMLHAAHASLFHWISAGTALHRQRGMWMIARVHMLLANANEAMRYSKRCLELTEEHETLMEDFDFAFAYEGAARAYAMAGNKEEALKYYAMADKAGKAIADDEDREIFTNDFEGGEWYGLIFK